MMSKEPQAIYVGDQPVLLQSEYQCEISSSHFNSVLINRENSATNIIVTKLVSPKNEEIHEEELGNDVPSIHLGNSSQLEEASLRNENVLMDNAGHTRKKRGCNGDEGKSVSDQSRESKLCHGSTVALCSMCGRHFSSNYNLKRHMNTCKQCPDHEKRPRFECHCGRTYSQEWDLKKHKASCRDVGKKCKNCLIPSCNLVFYHRSQLVTHMKKDHNVRILDPEVLEFPSLGDFLAWKEQEEERTCTYYSKQTGSNVTGVSINAYYICQHDGSERSHGATARKTERRNKKGRMKTGRVCWSQMNVKEFSDGKVKVTYFPSHTHPVSASDAEHHPLPPSISSEIKRRVADNSEDAIYTEYPELKKSKKKSYGMNVKTLRALARKNRKLFRITAEAVEDAGGKDNESKEVSENIANAVAIDPEEYSHQVKCEVTIHPGLLEACHSQWSQLSGLMESGKLSDSSMAQIHNTIGSLLESCQAEILQNEGSTEPALSDQLAGVIYQNEPLSPGAFPLSEEPQSELDLKQLNKTVYQVVTFATKEEAINSSPEDLLAVEFPREFIIIAKDQILHTVNPSQIGLS